MSVAVTLCRFVMVSAIVTLFAGCGDGGNAISGTVNFDGKPIPAGKIYFIPDESKGNTGAPGYATIVNGAYDTSAPGGKSPQLGPMKVTIEGNDPNATSSAPGDTSGEVTVKALFPSYDTTTEITAESSQVDFDVPASAANRRDTQERPTITP